MIKHIRTVTIIIGLFGGIPVVFLVLLTQPMLFPAKQELTAGVSTQALRDHVIQLSEKLPRRSDDTDKLDFSARYIKNQLSQYGSVEEHIYEVWGVPYRNVSITIGPKSRQRIVIGAHYDSFHGNPGADDNASGVAGLLELARLLSLELLTIPVQLIAYTLEEPPYFRSQDMGSAVHAKQLKMDNIDVVAMISLEMIGYYTDDPNSQDYPIPLMSLLYPTKGNFIAIVGNLTGTGLVRQAKSNMASVMSLPVVSINAPSIIPGVDFSDHLNFWNQNYPAIMVTDTAFYRNKAYHSNDDTWDRLDYEKMGEVVKGVYAVVMNMARREVQ